MTDKCEIKLSDFVRDITSVGHPFLFSGRGIRCIREYSDVLNVLYLPRDASDWLIAPLILPRGIHAKGNSV